MKAKECSITMLIKKLQCEASASDECSLALCFKPQPFGRKKHPDFSNYSHEFWFLIAKLTALMLRQQGQCSDP